METLSKERKEKKGEKKKKGVEEISTSFALASWLPVILLVAEARRRRKELGYRYLLHSKKGSSQDNRCYGKSGQKEEKRKVPN